MKEKILIPLFILCLPYSSMAYMFDFDTQTYVISQGSDINLIPTGTGAPFDILINNGGVYSLAALDSLSESENINQIQINFDLYGGGSNPMVILEADSGFDGVFSSNILVESNTQIKLTNAFLDGVVGDDVLHLDNLVSHIGNINIFREPVSNTDTTITTDSGDNSSAVDTDSGNNISDTTYIYNFNNCPDGVGICVTQNYSDTHITEQQQEHYEEQVILKSVQKNPKMLLRPMVAVSRHELLDYYDFSDEFFISVAPEYYVSKNFQNSGIRMNSGTKIGGRLNVGINTYITKSDFKNNVSDFKSYIYGGNMRLNYKINDMLFVRGVYGMNFSDVHCSDVKKGEATVNNPNAFGFYTGVDFGARFDFDSGLFVSPSVGYDLHSEKVVDVRERDSFVRFGNDVGFKYSMDGMSYNYILRTGINTYGKFDANVGIGVWLISDKIGGTVALGIVDSEYGLSGKVSGNIKVTF